MKKTLLEVYALLVCLVSVICLSISLGIGIYNFISVFDPEITLSSWNYEQHQTNDKFFEKSPLFSMRDDYKGNLKKEKPARPPEDILTKKRLDSYKNELIIEKRNGKQTILQSSIFIIISTILFLLHWRLAKVSRKEHTYKDDDSVKLAMVKANELEVFKKPRGRKGFASEFYDFLLKNPTASVDEVDAYINEQPDRAEGKKISQNVIKDRSHYRRIAKMVNSVASK